MASDLRTEDMFAQLSAAENAPSVDVEKGPLPDNALLTAGETLRHHREALSLTLDDCYKKLRIRKTYLSAIEQDDVAALPSSRTIVRAHVQAYAKMLNLDADILVSQFTDKHYPHVEPSINRHSRPLPILPRNSILFFIIAGLLVILTIGLLQNYLNIDKTLGITVKEAPLPTESQPKETIKPADKATEVKSAVINDTNSINNKINDTVRDDKLIKQTSLPEPDKTTQQAITTAEPSKTGVIRPLTAVRITHNKPIWVNLRKKDKADHRFILGINDPLNLALGDGVWLQIAEFDGVMITLINSQNQAVSDIPYVALASSENWINIDDLAR